MSGDQGGAKAPPIIGAEVHGWFHKFSPPHPSDADCVELAIMMTKLAWPEPVSWPPHPWGLVESSMTVWNFDGVPKAAQTMLANLPLMLSPFAVPAVPPGDAEGRAALVDLQAALNRALLYLQNPYARTDQSRHRLKSWHVPAVLLSVPIFGVLVRAGHPKPGITRNSIVAGVLQLALKRMEHGNIETGAIGQHLTRWFSATGMTTNDLTAYVTKT